MVDGAGDGCEHPQRASGGGRHVVCRAYDVRPYGSRERG